LNNLGRRRARRRRSTFRHWPGRCRRPWSGRPRGGGGRNGLGADAGIVAGDIIVRVHNTSITSNAELEKAEWDAGRPLVLVLVRNAKGTR
jgi:membrane-associated protease RseP (regulator of RpoE activity)